MTVECGAGAGAPSAPPALFKRRNGAGDIPNDFKCIITTFPSFNSPSRPSNFTLALIDTCDLMLFEMIEGVNHR